MWGFRNPVKDWRLDFVVDRRSLIEIMKTKTGIETGTSAFIDKLLFLIGNSFIFGGDFRSANPNRRLAHPFISNKSQPSSKYGYKSGYYYVKT